MADTLTDAELRKRLTALGHDVGPLNATTRPLWKKKLGSNAGPKKIQKVQPKISAARRAVAIGFSSDESDNETTRSAKAKPKSGRTTRTSKSTTRVRKSEILPPPAPVLTRPSLRRHSTANNSTPKQLTPKHNSTFVLDESDTDVTDSSAVMVSACTNTSPTVERCLIDTPPAAIDTNSERPMSTSTPEKTSSRHKLNLFTETSRTIPKYSRSIDRSDQFIPNTTSASKGGKQVRNNLHKNVRKRQKLDPTFDDSLSDEEDIKQQGFKTEESTVYSWTQYISLILVVVLTVFFLVLGATYINLRGEAERSYSAQKDNLMLCEKDAISNSVRETGPCFTSEEVSQALDALKPLYRVLSINAGQHDCGNKPMYKYRFLTRLQVQEIAKGINQTTMFHLIMNNDHWNIRLLGEHGETGIKDPSLVWFLESTSPAYPFLCKIQRFLTQMFNWIILMITIAVAFFFIWLLSRYYQRKKREEKAQVYDLVENIIETLKTHYDSSVENKDIQPYMAIPHVRDMLIAPHDRSSRQPIWDQAVKFLAANESRIRVETQVISGEEFPVWRWLHGYAANTSKGKKMWQGQAFAESPSNRSNTLPFSPTPCLKIRNMFDPDIEVGEWDVGICDVILEKCQDINDIVHISVDKTSTEGCVYLKCGTPTGAGKVYKALHGWWFDGNLVTVKFLRLERYHERFPDSVKCKTPLKPSSASNSWFSTL